MIIICCSFARIMQGSGELFSDVHDDTLSFKCLYTVSCSFSQIINTVVSFAVTYDISSKGQPDKTWYKLSHNAKKHYYCKTRSLPIFCELVWCVQHEALLVNIMFIIILTQ